MLPSFLFSNKGISQQQKILEVFKSHVRQISAIIKNWISRLHINRQWHVMLTTIKKNWGVGNPFLEEMLYKIKILIKTWIPNVGAVTCSASDTTLQPCLLKLLQHEFLHHGWNRKNGPTNSSCLLLFLNQFVSQWKWRRHDPVIQVLQTI